MWIADSSCSVELDEWVYRQEFFGSCSINRAAIGSIGSFGGFDWTILARVISDFER